MNNLRNKSAQNVRKDRKIYSKVLSCILTLTLIVILLAPATVFAEGEPVLTQTAVKVNCEAVINGSKIPMEAIKYSNETELSGVYYFDKSADLGPIAVGEEGLTMIIADGVTVTFDASSYDNCAGIKATFENGPLVITTGAAQNGDGTYPTLIGTGVLIAKGGSGAAGIGGNADEGCDASQITIESGNVYAYGGDGGAGIGGGCEGSAYEININENTSDVSTYVEAYGGAGAAGIGGGAGVDSNPTGHDITIAGGTVKAYGGVNSDDSTKGGAGIGSGAGQAAYGIIVSDGNVTAESGGNGAGIGSGSEGEAYDITISGGIVNATSEGNGAGIGSGSGMSAKRITIMGGEITATSNGNGAGIGSGSENEVDGITISGGTVIATSKGSGAGIGGGYKGEGKNITIDDGNITAESLDGGAGIGGGYNGKANIININGGLITAFGSTKDTNIGYGLGQGGAGNQENIYVDTSVVSYHCDDKTNWVLYPAKSGDLTKDRDWNRLKYSCFKTDNGVTPSITVGTQVGTPQYGTASESSYTVTTSYVSGENWNFNWYEDAEGTTPCDAPADTTTYESTDSCGIMNGATTPAGTWYFTISCGEIASNIAEYKVAKLNATITSGSASKVYDGTCLDCEDYEVSGFLEGEGVNVACTGSQTQVGESPNTFVYDAKDGTNLDNYLVKEECGTLVVTNDLFVVTGENYSGLYDGTYHDFSVKVIGKNGKDLTNASSIVYSTSYDDINWGDWKSDVPKIKDAGTLYVKAKAKYSSTEVESSVYTITVNRRSLILTSGSAQKEYDGAALKSTQVEISGDGFVDGEGFTSAPVATGTITKIGRVSNNIGNVSSYTDTTLSANYKIVMNPGILSIIPKSVPITITTPSNSKKYDGQAIGVGMVSYTDGILENGDTLTVTLSRIGDNVVKNAGTYDNGIDSYQVTNGSGENVTNCYTFAEPVIGQLTIDKRYITLTSESKVFICDGYEHIADNVTVSGEGLADEDTLNYSDFTVVKEIIDEPVDNTFTYSGSGDFNPANYSITMRYGKLSVVSEIGITGANAIVTYDGNVHTAPAVVAGTANSPQYSTSVDGKTWSSYSTTVPSMKDAGTLYIKAKVDNQSKNAETSYTLIVRPRYVTIGTKSATKPYDGTALTASESSDVIITGQGFAAGETPDITITGTQTDVGSSKNSFSYKFSGIKEQNYLITEEPGTLTVTVNDKPIIITSASDEQTYNGMPLTNTHYTALWGGVDVDDLDGKLCGNDVLNVMPIGSITDVGSVNNEFYYQIVRDGVDVTDFYTFGELNEGTLVVTKRSIVINTASDEKVYDGTALANENYTITGDGFISGEGFETVNVIGTRINAGTAPNEISGVMPYTFKAGTKEENYEVSVVTGTLKVNKRKVSVASASAISTWTACGEGGLSNATVTVNGNQFVQGEADPKGVTILARPETQSGCPVSAVNEIDYQWSGNGNPANYEITEKFGTLKIVKDTTTGALANSYIGIYDGLAHSGSFDSTLSDPKIEYSTNGSTWGSDQPSYKDAGTYKYFVKVSDKDDPTKKATCSINVTINKRDLTITAGSATKVYDGTALICSDYSIGGDGYADGESAEIVIGTMSGNELVDVGTDKNVVKKVKAKNGFKGSNYKISSFEGTLEITKRPVIIISKALGLTPETKVAYDGQVHSLKEVVEVGNTSRGGIKKIEGMGFVGDQGLDYSNFTTAKDAGFYKNAFDYSAKAGTNMDNYTIKCLYGVIKISPRSVTLTSANGQKKYDGTPLTKEIIYTTTTETGDAFVDGEGADYDVTGIQTRIGKSANTFNYTLKAGTKETNYDITTVEGTLEVYGNNTLRIVVPENQDYEYDGKPHGNEAKAYIGDQPCSETIWYSIDGGITYVDEAPQLTDVGSQKVLVHVDKKGYTRAEGEYTITINKSKALDIEVPENTTYNYDGKPHGEKAKAYIDDELCTDANITYSTDGGNTWTSKAPQLTDEGTLNVIAKAEKKGYETAQKNYTITINKSKALDIEVPENTTYNYDGKPHGEKAKAYIDDELCTDANITYSTDGGNTWTSKAPQLTDKGTLNVIAKAEKKGYETAQKNYTITVKDNSVKTGDTSNMLPYIIMVIVSVGTIGIVFTAIRRKRKNQ